MAFCGATPFELGEFHHLCQDTHRSSLPLHELGAFGFPSFTSAFEAPSRCTVHEEERSCQSHAWFWACTNAPSLPQDGWFYPARTNFWSSRPAGELGNHLLEFLDAEVTSRVTKVQTDKFCVKFAVDVQGFQADVKVRIYSMGDGAQHMVEFQRHSGDATVFSSIFQRAKKMLQGGDALPESCELVLLPELKFGNKDSMECCFLTMDRQGADECHTHEASPPQLSGFDDFSLEEPVSDDAFRVWPSPHYWGPLKA